MITVKSTNMEDLKNPTTITYPEGAVSDKRKSHPATITMDGDYANFMVGDIIFFQLSIYELVGIVAIMQAHREDGTD